MIEQQYRSELDRERVLRHLFIKLGIALVCANVILGLCLLNINSGEKIIIIPPTIDKSFRIEGGELSREYLEMLGEWLAGLPLSVTPDSVQVRNERFLRYIAPADHARIKAEFDLRVERIREENISTLFFPVSFQTHLAARQVAITGDFITIVSGVPGPAERKTWRLSFEVENGTYWLTEFKEVERGNAFNNDTDPADSLSE